MDLFIFSRNKFPFLYSGYNYFIYLLKCFIGKVFLFDNSSSLTDNDDDASAKERILSDLL